jgi:plasmid rolling circle replication initiator protein Rep
MAAIVPRARENSSDSEYAYLRDESPKDKRFDEARAWADTLQKALVAAGLLRPAERVSQCALELFFDLRPDDDGVLHHKLASAAFCHWRHCPMCQQRRSLRNKARFLEALPGIEKAHPGARWLMLTLTVRNCPVEELRATITAMNKAWNRLTQRSEFQQVKGWVRATEVTKAADDTAHPHFHCLLMVSPSYFAGRHYVTQARWVQVWREVAKLDYDPIVDVRVVRPKVRDGVQVVGALVAAAAEVLKYSTKAEDLAESPEWLAEYIKQVHCLKFLTSGGALAGIFKDKPTDDLVHIDEDGGESELGEPVARLRYDWHPRPKRYARKKQQWTQV